MNGPLPEESRISLLVVVPLLGMDPWNSKDHLLLVQPLETGELSAVDHPDQPVPHPLGSVRVHGVYEGLRGDGGGFYGCEGGDGVRV